MEGFFLEGLGWFYYVAVRIRSHINFSYVCCAYKSYLRPSRLRTHFPDLLPNLSSQMYPYDALIIQSNWLNYSFPTQSLNFRMNQLFRRFSSIFLRIYVWKFQRILKADAVATDNKKVSTKPSF